MGVLSKLKSRMAGAPQKKVPNTKNKVADIKEFVGKRRDTIRVGSNYKVGDRVEEYELEDAIKKQTGDFPQLSVQDYSAVKQDKKGNLILDKKDIRNIKFCKGLINWSQYLNEMETDKKNANYISTNNQINNKNEYGQLLEVMQGMRSELSELKQLTGKLLSNERV